MVSRQSPPPHLLRWHTRGPAVEKTETKKREALYKNMERKHGNQWIFQVLVIGGRDYATP